MKRRHFLYATSTAFLINALRSPIAAQTAPRKLAFLVGINDYSQGKGMTISNLKGCVNDVLLLKKLLQYRYGFNENDIVTLTNAEATRENILDRFEKHILQQAGPNDIVVVSFSGHGSPLLDPYDRNPSKITTGFVPHNFTVDKNGISNFITGTTFFLLRSAIKTNKATFIFDCCYAESIKRNEGLVRSTGKRPGAKTSRPSPEEKDYQIQLMRQLNLNEAKLTQNRLTQKGTKGILLAAAAENELALDSNFTEVLSAGAYTKALTEILWTNPSTSFESVAQSVSTRLAQSSQNTQQPAIIYSTDESRSLLTQPSFFISSRDRALNLTTQGIVETVNEKDRQVTLWLGCCSSRSLNLPPGSQFKLLNNEQTIVTLTSKIRADFTAIASIPPDKPLPTPGTLVQTFYRALSKDFQLLLELDPSLGDRFTLPTQFARIQTTKRTNLTSNADLVFSQMTAEYYEAQNFSDRPAIGSYGLFTNELVFKPGTFGRSNETPEAALDRLQPDLKKAIIQKFLRTMVIDEQELSAFPGLSANLRLKRTPQKIIATPNQVKQSISPNTEVELVIQNSTSEELELLLIGIPPNGKLSIDKQIRTVQRNDNHIIPFTVLLEDGIGFGEVLLLLGNNLAELNEQLPQLIQELNLDERRTQTKDKARTVSQLDHLVISLPIEMKAQ